MPVPCSGGDLDDDGVAAPGLGHELALGQLLQHPCRVGFGPVHLVDGHDDGDVGRLGVVDGLNGLGHHTVVGRHHEDDDVGGLGTAGPHGGERGVARRVDERDAVVVPDDLVGTDVLGDAAGLPGHDVGRADAVEQQRLAVVDVAHDGDDRGPGPLVGVVLLVLVLEVAGQELRLLLFARVDQPHVGADLGREELDHVVGQRLRRHDHLALQEQEAHDVTGAAVELRAEIASRRAALDDDLTVGHGCRRRLVRGELRGLELLEVAPAPAGPPLWGSPPRHAATSTRRRGTTRRSTTRTTAEATATTGGTASVAATGRAAGSGGTAGTTGGSPAGALRVGTTRTGRRRAGATPTHAGRWWDGTATRAERRP